MSHIYTDSIIEQYIFIDENNIILIHLIDCMIFNDRIFYIIICILSTNCVFDTFHPKAVEDVIPRYQDECSVNLQKNSTLTLSIPEAVNGVLLRTHQPLCVTNPKLPNVTWSNPPNNTVSMALIIEHTDTQEVYLNLFNMKPDLCNMNIDEILTKVIVPKNSWNDTEQQKYTPKCDYQTYYPILKKYLFKLYALTSKLDNTMPPEINTTNFESMFKNKIIGTAELRLTGEP